MKLPSFFKKVTPFQRKTTSRPRQMKATAARRQSQAFDEYDEDEEPTTRLSSAFIIVLLLHLVAVGGIYAFNGIKAHRRSQELMAGPMATPAPKAPATQVAQAKSDAAFLSAATPAPLPAMSRPSSPSLALTAAGKVHHVKPGETLPKVAMMYGLSSAELASANALKENATLHPNQTLTIPAPPRGRESSATRTGAPATATSRDAANEKTKADFLKAFKTGATSAPNPTSYTVAKNDTATSIARRFGISSEELLKVNKIDDPKKLQIGQALKIPAKTAKTNGDPAG